MTYTKISVDDFTGSSLDESLWTDFAIGGMDPSEFVVAGGNLTINVGSNDPQLFVNPDRSGTTPGFYDLTNSIYAFKYSKGGSPTDSTAELDFSIRDSENTTSVGITSRFNTHSWNWVATGGLALDAPTGTSSGMGTDWVNGYWLGLGLIGDDGVVHLLKSSDGVTWIEIGSAHIFNFDLVDGISFNRKNLYVYIAPYDVPSGSPTMSLVIQEIAIFWNGTGIPPASSPGITASPFKIKWDTLGSRLYQLGVDRGMLYVGSDVAVPWNGLVNVTETSDSGNPQEVFVDGDKILDIQAQEDFAATVDAYSAPIEFAPCAGRLKLSTGLYATGQKRKLFGFSYRTLIGNDSSGTSYAYKIHVVYNARAQNSDIVNTTIGSTPSPRTYSLGITTSPVPVNGQKPTAHMIIDSRLVSSGLLATIENVLYGDSTHAPRLPSIQQLISLAQGSGVLMHKMKIASFDYISGSGEISMHKMRLSGTEGKIFGTGSIKMFKPVLTGAGTVTSTGSTRRVGAMLGYYAANNDTAASFLSTVGGSRYQISHFFYGTSVPTSLASAGQGLPAEQTAGRRACIDFEPTHYGVGGSPAAGAVTDKNKIITFLTDCQSNGLDFIVCLWHEPYNKFNIQSTQALNNLDYTNSMRYYGAALRAIGVKVLFDVSNYSANHHHAETIGTAAAPGLGWAACSAGLIDDVYTDWYVNEGNSSTTPAGSGIQGTWNNIQALADTFGLPLGILELGPAPAKNDKNWNDADIQAFLTLVRNSLDSRVAAGKQVGNIIWWATDDNATQLGMYLSANWSSGTLAKYRSMFDAYNGTSGSVATGIASVRMKKMKVSGAGSPTSPIYRAVVLADSPSVYYRLGDASSPAVPDAGAGGVNASMTGSVTFGQPGALLVDSDKSVTFPGTVGNDLVTASSPGSAYDLGDGPWSIEFWFKLGALGVQQDFIGKGTNAYIVRFSSNNKITIVVSGTGTVFATTAAFTDTTSWHHLVITRVAATQPHIYVDGVDQVGVYTPFTFANTTSPFRMGESTSSANAFNGQLDEVALYKSALSQARVTAHYNAGISVLNRATGSIRMHKMGLSGTASVSIITGTGSIRMHKKKLVGVGTEKIIGTGSIRMHKMSLFGRQSYRTVVLVDSPSVYYRLGDSSAPAVKDAGAGGVNAAMNGTVTFGQTGALVGDSDKAVLFSGLAGNDLATAATPGSAYDLGDGPWSIEFWYKTSVINTQQDLIGKGTNAYIVRISSNNKFSIVKSGSPAVLVFNTTAAFTDTTRWHHVVITRVAATKPHIYVDGVDQTGVYTAATFSDTTTAFRMGESTLTGSPYTGLLDEVAIYKSVLSQARVTAHYNAGT